MELATGSTIFCEFCATPSPIKDMEWYVVFDRKTLLCPLCVKYFDEQHQEAYSPGLDDWSEEFLPPIVPWKGGIGGGANYAVAKPLPPSCYHNGTPLVIGDYTVYLSASRDVKTPLQGKAPTAAIYLDNTWVRGMVFTNDSFTSPVKNGIRLMYANWPDFGVVTIEAATLIVKWVREAWKGGDVVEVGCIGGHGRTGTMAALLCVSEGMGWRDAMQYVRKTYCDKAIENNAQEAMVQEYAESLR
jgi:protein-tyrosine phosphatase